MEGRRFGIGLAAGLLFALVIVGASGLASSAAVLSGAANNGSPPRTGVSTQPSLDVSGNQTNFAAAGSGPASGFSSNLSSLGRLSGSSLGLLVAPIVAALILGASAYRISRHRREGSKEG